MLVDWIGRAYKQLLMVTMSDSAVREFTKDELDTLTTATEILGRHLDNLVDYYKDQTWKLR